MTNDAHKTKKPHSIRDQIREYESRFGHTKLSSREIWQIFQHRRQLKTPEALLANIVKRQQSNTNSQARIANDGQSRPTLDNTTKHDN